MLMQVHVLEISYWTCTRGVVTGQVFRYPPDHFFSKLPEWLPIRNGWSLLALLANWIAFDINCSWLFRSYYDRDCHAPRPQFYLQDESETFSGGLKIQNFHGEACPSCTRTLLVPRTLEITRSLKISWLRPCVLITKLNTIIIKLKVCISFLPHQGMAKVCDIYSRSRSLPVG